MDDETRAADVQETEELPPEGDGAAEHMAPDKTRGTLRALGLSAVQKVKGLAASLRAPQDDSVQGEAVPQADEQVSEELGAAGQVPFTHIGKDPEQDEEKTEELPEGPGGQDDEQTEELPEPPEPEEAQAQPAVKKQGRRAKKRAKKKAEQTARMAALAAADTAATAADTPGEAPPEITRVMPEFAGGTQEAEGPVPEGDTVVVALPGLALMAAAEDEDGEQTAELGEADTEPTQAAEGVKPAASGAKRKKKRRKKAGVGAVMWRMFVNVMKLVFVFVCVAAIAVAVVAVQVVDYVVGATQNDDTLLDLELRSYSQTSYIMVYDPETEEWFEYQELISATEHRIWVDLSQVPDDLINAVIATEDREFYDHHGFSITRTGYALLNEVFEMRNQFGASTIDQQLVKNITGEKDIEDEDGNRSAGYLRKLREIFRAWGLNNRYSKDMILEAYLNTIGLSEKMVGVQAGARMYFNKDVSELNLWECATIAGITQAPTYYSPIQNPDNALGRRNDVLYFMLECEYITQEEYTHAIAQPLGLDTTEYDNTTESVFSYFSDQVFNDVVGDLMTQQGYTYGEAVEYIYTGGLRIYATMDLQLQEVMEDVYYHAYDEDGYLTNFKNMKTGRYYKDDLTMVVEEKDEEGNVIDTHEVLPQSAAVSVRYDGSLAAVVGGIGEKETSLTLNRATQSTRQVGSTMKPIGAYALGIDLGLINWSSMFEDSPSQHSNPNNSTGSPDWPKNATQSYRRYNVPVVTAVAESINTVAVRVGTFVGIEEMFYFMRDTLQISSLVAPGELVYEDGTVSTSSDMAISPLTLGALTNGISPYEMAGAYTIFGGEDSYGVYNTLHSYYYVEDSKGSTVLKPNVTQVQAISSESGYIMNRLLAGVFGDNTLPGNGSPTARNMKPAGDMDAVSKTGTTNNDSDRWFIGLTPYYVTAVWWGYDQNPEDPSQNRIYRYWTRAASGNVTPNLWKTIMERGQEGLEYKEFPAQPETVVQQRYCTVSGMKAAGGCPSAVGYYHIDDDLLTPCVGHASLVNGEPREDDEAGVN